MFNIEVIKMIQRKKMREQSNANISDDIKDNLKKEINYLNLVIIRYEIAKLLGLENNQDYINVNFLGIENENVHDYNLTPEQMNEYNRLVAQIPPEQMQRYFIRKAMADVIGEENSSKFKDKDYEGIENFNPALIRYNFTTDQIKKFTDLAANLASIGVDSTTRVDVKKEAEDLIRGLFNELNIDDSTKYNNIKNYYFSLMDILLETIDENTKNTIFLDVSNYDLAYDLIMKYPEVKVKMSINGIKSMINNMDLSNMTPEKYDKCLEMLCSNINELYAEDSNKVTIEGLINGVRRENYSLRSDLVSHLGDIENVKLDIQDNEYIDFINYIDGNYDSFKEVDRQKYFSLLKRRIDIANDGDVPALLEFLNKNFDKLSDQDKSNYYSLLKIVVSRDINNLEKTEDLNALLVKLTNKDLSKRLQKDFSNNQNIKFGNKHLSSYDALVQDTVSKLEKKKMEYQKKKENAKGSFFGTYYAVKIKDIDREIERVKKINPAGYENSFVLKNLDDAYNGKTTQIIALNKEIEELKGIKEQLKSNFQKKRIDKKIAKRNEKIKKLQQSKIKIVGKQKKIMLPSLALERRKGRFNDHAESKAEVFTDYANEYKILADTERRMGGYFGKIKALFYDLKSNKYESKAAFNRNMCDLLRASNVKINGSNRYIVASKLLNQARNNQIHNVQVNMGK